MESSYKHYNPQILEDYILEDSKNVIEKIKDCIEKDKMNLILIGNVENNFPITIIKLYFEIKYKCQNYKENILILDSYKDNNIFNNNEVEIFSKKQSLKKKFIIIYNSDHISENDQSYFKIYMNKNTNYIFITKHINKIYQTIITRTCNIEFKELSYDTYNSFINHICKLENITIDDYDKDFIIKNSDKNILFLLNFIDYLKLLNIKKLNKYDSKKYIYISEFNLIEEYFTLLSNKNIMASNNILNCYYEKGYSLLDIYFFLIEYLKNNSISKSLNKFKIIKIISKYINDIYDGYDDKIMLFFFTNDIIKI